jgi:L-threonylcarbamoyladenylate synthase
MQTEILWAGTPGAIMRAARVLGEGGLVAFPTDTVYGVGSSPFLPAAIERLFAVKGRPLEKAIPILLPDARRMRTVASEIPDAAWILAERFWPGALTIIVPKAPQLPDVLCAGGPSVAVRVPDLAVARILIVAAGGAVAATSANISGDPPALTPKEALAALDGRIDLLIDGGHVPGGVASTVVDLTGSAPRVLRPGPISMEAIEQALSRASGHIKEPTDGIGSPRQ